MNGLRERRSGELVYLEASGRGWRAVFSTRHGGVSRGPLATLDLSYSVGDDRRRVDENRRRLAAAAGYDGRMVVACRQVHGTHIVDVDAGTRGRGAMGPEDALPDTDGLTTSLAGVPLMVSVADCVPVALVAGSPVAVSVAALHAGWRGMLAGIAGLGARRLEHRGPIAAAVVGPSIGPCCFTVGDEVGRQFAAAFPGSWADGRVDLWAVAVRQLSAAGVPPDCITVAGICTVCDRRFFSHRRDAGRSGRQAAVVWLEDADTGFLADPPGAADDSA